MPFREPQPELISSNPGGPQDPLGESILDPGQADLRVFEPRDLRIVIGRHQDAAREVHVDRARCDGVPVHRRVSGGGAVVLAPGMVVIAWRLPRVNGGVDRCFALVNQRLREALEPLLPQQRVVCRGHGDLALEPQDGSEAARKICGASLRQSRDHAYYLGVLMVRDAIDLIERYLRPPSRQPDYRADRPHRAFCTCLAAHGCRLDAVLKSVGTTCQQGLPT